MSNAGRFMPRSRVRTSWRKALETSSKWPRGVLCETATSAARIDVRIQRNYFAGALASMESLAAGPGDF